MKNVNDKTKDRSTAQVVDNPIFKRKEAKRTPGGTGFSIGQVDDYMLG